jgi:hypothetical protein
MAYSHADFFREPNIHEDRVGKQANKLDRDSMCFYVSNVNCPNITIIREEMTKHTSNNGKKNNQVNYANTKLVVYAYGYIIDKNRKEDAFIEDSNRVWSFKMCSMPRSDLIRLKNGEKYTVYFINLTIEKNSEFDNTLTNANKCFTHIIPPADKVFPTKPLEELTEGQQAELLGIEPASPSHTGSVPEGFRTRIGGKSARRSYRRKHSRKRSTRRRRHSH